MPFLPLRFIGLASVLLVTGCQHATAPFTTPASPPATGPASASPETSYVFGWGELPAALVKPRGGSTRRAPVTLAPGVTLPLATIAAFDRDRAASLALAGDFKVSFHFMESLGLTADYAPTCSYHSWATEHIRVIADTGRFISLQHTLVMLFKNADGTMSEPMLNKHWRQDWSYEPAELHTFRGAETFARHRPARAESAGAWSQSVWQAEGSPRYAALGRWEHRGNLTVWTGENSFRPLPRREHTVRKDYAGQ